MAQDVEKLIVSLEANLKQYERELARAQKLTVTQLRKIEVDMTSSASRMEKTFARAGSALAGFGKGLVIGGITAAVAGLEELVRGSITSAAAIGDLSDKLGITSDKLQELQYGAVQANMSFEDMQTGLLKFSKALGEAQNGSGDLVKILTANGFSKAQIKAMDYGKALDVVADLIRNAKNEQDAYAITLAATGKGGEKFLEFLRGGSAGLKTFGTDAHKAGDIIDTELIKSAQKFDDAWAAALLHVKSGITTFVLEAVNELSKVPDNSGGGRYGTRQAGTAPPRRFLGEPPPHAAQPPSTFAGSGSYLKPTKTVLPDPDAEAEKKRLKDLAEQRSRNIQRQIGDLRSLFAAVDASNVQQEVAIQLSRYDVEAKSAEGKAISDLVEKTMMHRAVLESVAFAAQHAAEKQQDFIDSEIALAEQGIDAFQRWAIEGDKLSDVIAGLASSLLKAAVQASLFGSGPLAGLFGTSQGGGIFNSLFNPPKLYAKGGRIGSGEVGIAGEAGPELIRGPAQVIPFSKMGGSGDVKVNVHNYGNDNVNVQRRQGQGGPSIDVIIGQKIDNHFSSGRANKVMGVQFGLPPAKARR